MTLLEKLEENRNSDTLPMHMPGHKRKEVLCPALPFGLDITETDGFDNLHNRRGILKELSERLAKVKNAAYAIPLVGGSTAGILSAVKAMTTPGDRVIMARGCHKSVYHAAEICRLNTEYIYPQCDEKNGFPLSVTAHEVKKAFDMHPDAKLVIITSPTYEGVISDIKEIAEITHRHGAKLLVDGAHGAHLGLGGNFPADPATLGADAVTESLHKTLPALTQTAALFLSEGTDPAPFERALGIFETSSPSYVLLSSIDCCVSMLGKSGSKLFENFSSCLDSFGESVKDLRVLDIPGYTSEINCFGYDRSKIIISCAGADITGPVLGTRLRKDYHIEPEMVSRDYVLCMTSVCDDEKSLTRLSDALIEIDRTLEFSESTEPVIYPEAVRIYGLSEACGHKECRLPVEDCRGKVSLSYLWAYPPGIPIAAPGEMITENIVKCIESLEKSGVEVLIEGQPDCNLITVTDPA